jgi:hypothetical protein
MGFKSYCFAAVAVTILRLPFDPVLVPDRSTLADLDELSQNVV